MNETVAQFIQGVEAAIAAKELSKLTFSKPPGKSRELRNIYARLVQLKTETVLSCTFRYQTRDETKNYSVNEIGALIQDWLLDHFRNADLFTVDTHWSLQTNKKGNARLRQEKTARRNIVQQHDEAKQRSLDPARPYLYALGITSKEGQVLQSGQRKFRQISKYIELVGHLLKAAPLPPNGRIVDMGSGKGYLTFALYDFLTNELAQKVQITGVELRPKLVAQCQQLAKEQQFEQLSFHAGDIHQYEPPGGIHMLIALHACDTATDEAIAKGIRAGADIIVVAPCCQKQVRRDMAPPAGLRPMLQHGILLERQAEMLTDSIRALSLEAYGYNTKVFEFVGTEHTPKNVMITATKAAPNAKAQQDIEQLMATFGVKRHYLLELLADV